MSEQCLTCKKRQVKCDSATPSCHRCQSDGKECRGYKSQLRIIAIDPSKKTSRHKQKRRNSNSRPKPSVPVLDVVTSSSDSPSHPRSSSFDILGAIRPSGDRDLLAILDSIDIYNDTVVPRASSHQRLFVREAISRQVPWHELPKVLQHAFITFFRSTVVNSNNTEPLLQHEICFYRGLTMHGLKEQLPDAPTEECGIALVVAALLMASDMYSQYGSWFTHFSAVRRIMALRGGLAHCLEQFPSSRNLLLNYMLVDIFTTTTCNTAVMFSDFGSLELHSHYLAFISDWLDDIPLLDVPCPKAILHLIVRTNLLRICLQNATVDKITRETAVKSIRERIESFNATTWALRVLDVVDPTWIEGRNSLGESELKSITALGLCYQSASLVYLLRSCKESTTAAEDIALDNASLVLKAHNELLFQQARGHSNGPIATQLWKFNTWPVAIQAYSCSAWSATSDDSSPDAQLDSLRSTATSLNSRQLLSIIQHVDTYCRSDGGDPIMPRGWDAGFPHRHAFGL